MALDFLGNSDSTSSSPLSAISQLLNLGGQVIGANTTAQGYVPVAAEGQQNQALSNQTALLQALTDPNNTIYKNLVAGQQQQLNGQTQQGLQSLLEMNRKAQLMGRGQFFNPERQDEAVSQYLGNQATSNATNARSNALNQIISAANGYGTNANSYGNMVKNQQAAQAKNNAALPSALSQGGNILSQFGNSGGLSNIMGGLGSLGSSIGSGIGDIASSIGSLFGF